MSRGNIKGGVVERNAFGRGPASKAAGDLFRIAFLDRNCGAIREVEVDGGGGREDIERNVVMTGGDGDAIGADFVGGIAIGRNAVGADENGLNFTFQHDPGGHVIADEGNGDAGLFQFPRGKACALEERAGFIGEDVQGPTLFMGEVDGSEGGSVEAGGQAAGVTMGQNRIDAIEKG